MSTDPVRKTITVPLRPDAAFRLFTQGLAEWWPGDTHSLSAARQKKPRDIQVGVRKGEHITEITADGEPARWATITVYEPGNRFAFDWYVGRSEDEATQVDVVFTPVDTGTRVDLTHDGFARLGETATAMAESYRTGWGLVLGQYQTRAAKVLVS